MMVKPVKKRAIQEWKMTEAIQPKEKVPDPAPKAIMNHVEKTPRATSANLLNQPSVMHPSHPFHIPPHGVMIQGDPHAAMRNHYVEPMYIHAQSLPRSTGPPNVIIRPPERQPPPPHPALINHSDITGLPGRGAKRPQMPQDMAAVEAKASSKKRRKPEGTRELVMSPFLNGSINGTVHINEKMPPIQPIILDFEVPLPPISPTSSHSEDRLGAHTSKGDPRKMEPFSGQAMSPVHSPAREEDTKPGRLGAVDSRNQPSKSGPDPSRHSLFKKPDINHYKSSVSTGGTKCFICQNPIIPNQKDYPVAPSGLVICTKCRTLAKSGSPVAIGPPPKIQIPSRSSQSRSQPQQRIPRSPVAKSPAASLTLPRSPINPKSPSAKSPAPTSPLPNSSPSSPANTLSAPNSPASVSGLSVPGSPRYSAPNSPRYSAPSSPRNSEPSSPVSRPPGSPQLRHPSVVAARSPHQNSSSVSAPTSPRPTWRSHLDVHHGTSKASPTGSLGAVASSRSGSVVDSPVTMENLQLPPGREGDDTTIRALLQLGRMRADSERRSLLQGSNSTALDQGDLRLPKTLADISKLDHAQLLELHHRLRYAGLPSRCQGSQRSPNNEDPVMKNSKGHLSGKPSLSPNSAQSVLQLADRGNVPPLIRSEGVVGTALPITALPPQTEEPPLKISRVIRSAQDRDHSRSYSSSDPRSRVHDSLESLHKTNSHLIRDLHADKLNKCKKDGTTKVGTQIDMFRDQYKVFPCHCTGSEVFFIKCLDCDFICNSIFGMELHVTAQRHGEARVPPPRDPDFTVDEQSYKESRADSEASHSSFETQSADTEAEGSLPGSPPRTAQEASSNVYSPLPVSIPEAWREQMSSRMRSGSGVVDLGSTVPHVNIPRPLGVDTRLHRESSEHPSPLDLSGKRMGEGSLLEHHHRERNGSRERRSHELNGPLDLSGYKHIQTHNSQFVSSQRLGSVGSMIEKSVATSVPSLALSQSVSQSGLATGNVPSMMLPGAQSSASRPPYPIPTMLYPLSSLAGTIPLLAPIQFQSSSAPPSPSHARHLEGTQSQPRRASFSLAPPIDRSSKSASPSPSTSSPPSRQSLTIPQSSAPHHPSQGSSRGKALNYQGGMISIQPSSSSSATPQKTVTLESQFSCSSPATPQGSHSPMPSSPAPLLSSTVPSQSVWTKSEPHSDGETDQPPQKSDADKPASDSPIEKPDKEDRQVDKENIKNKESVKDKTKENEKEVDKEQGKSNAVTKIQAPTSTNPQPPVQIKIEPDT